MPWVKIGSIKGPQGEGGEGAYDDTEIVAALASEAITRAAADAALDAAKAALVHSHTSAQITDFVEAAQDAVAALLSAGSNVTLDYNDGANTLTVTAVGDGTGIDPEAVRDAMGIALVGVGVVTVTVNDALDTITISSTATANSTDAALRDRSTHTGEQAISTITGLEDALEDASETGHILIENGAEVPPGTPVGTIVYEKA